MKQETLYEIIWPHRRWVDADKLIQWAQDDVYNGYSTLPLPKTVEDAIDILADSGTITVGKGRR